MAILISSYTTTMPLSPSFRAYCMWPIFYYVSMRVYSNAHSQIIEVYSLFNYCISSRKIERF